MTINHIIKGKMIILKSYYFKYDHDPALFIQEMKTKQQLGKYDSIKENILKRKSRVPTVKTK